MRAIVEAIAEQDRRTEAADLLEPNGRDAVPVLEWERLDEDTGRGDADGLLGCGRRGGGR